VSWSQIYGGACLAGIGFTMSMFVDQLAFSDPAHVDRAKIGILVASVVAAGWGGVVLALRLPRQKVQPTVTVPPKS
jgi:NhaA family Na+:H+ antiporter